MTPRAATTETPATRSLACWLWAAWPNNGRRLDLERIGHDLGRSSRTLRRWIADDRSLDSLGPIMRRRVRQRAILRGRGTYLWPDVDAGTAARQEARQRHAQRAYLLTQHTPGKVPSDWDKLGATAPHTVLVAHYPKAHVYAVAAVSSPKVYRRIELAAEILATAEAPDRYQAHLLKDAVLAQHADHRCIAPADIVPYGHTETWRERGGHQPIPALRDVLAEIR